ncbi:hypothetical protein ZHAS_00008532 [Anopheles sinensis]|uniref:Uncharacterized protein n=1 Tax=Anopheles sinensis TaxID=74873 RepID=A0A084VSY3_ANOSI|nr:hypothetical protein ZHAS_00008532 [Anopheles sinensis]
MNCSDGDDDDDDDVGREPKDGALKHGRQEERRHSLPLDQWVWRKSSAWCGDGVEGVVEEEDEEEDEGEEEVWTNRRYRIEKVLLNAIFSMQF